MSMNRQETIKLLAMFQANYPYAYKHFDELMLQAAVQLWQQSLQDLDASLVYNIASKIMMTSTDDFPPKIAVLRQECIKASNPEIFITPEEAWETVLRAIKKFGYYRQDEAFKTFSEPIRRTVNYVGWANICRSENIGIERANFCKVYNSFETNNRERAVIPTAIFDRIQQLTEQKALEQPNESKTKS
jgi:hypothetical protein